MAQKKQEYNLFTAISMIIGIVIGSGIFFKSDDVLFYTGGNVTLGVILFVVAGISILFGSLSVAQVALRTNKPGGLITYIEEAWGRNAGGAIGWFNATVYNPTLCVVVSWVAGIYIAMLFGLPSSLEIQCLIGFIVLVFIFLLNIFAKKIGGYFQISTTIIKMIPLFLFAILGLVKGNPSNITAHTVVEGASSVGFLAALVPIAFSFDGWIVSTSISHEIKNSKKNLPLALIISPIFIVLAYSLYLVGLSALVGPQEIVSLGDAHVDVAATKLFGANGAKIVLVFVVISVLGTVNGLTMGLIRMPYSLAERNTFPQSNIVKKISEKYDVPMTSAVISFFIVLAWYVIHYIVTKFGLLQGADVSEIAIVVNYLCFIGIYIAVMKLYKKGEIKSRIHGIFNPIMAIIGSFIIFAGSALIISEEGISLNLKSITFMAISFTILISSYFYCKKTSKVV